MKGITVIGFNIKTVLMLLEDKSFNSLFLSCFLFFVFCFFLFFFWFYSKNQQHLQLLNPSHTYLSPIGGFHKVTLSRTWGFIVMLIQEKLNYILKTDVVIFDVYRFADK